MRITDFQESRMMKLVLLLTLAVVSISGQSFLRAEDWSRFRGPNGSGVSSDTTVPVEWSDSQNLKWKTPMPGPGASSPIVVGSKVILTCWSGYGLSRDNPGDIGDLVLHLVCVDREDGKIAWTAPVSPTGKEEEYRGMFAEHGYTSHTPCSDGQRVYAFFGKSGLVAFDLEGNRLWDVSLGTESDPRGWGSASSPILYKNMVIVPATAESESIVALDKESGDVLWKQEARGFSGTWGTPVLSQNAAGEDEIVMGVPYEIWGLNPENGKLKWYAETVDSDSMCSSVVEHDGVVYVVEGRSGGSAAVKVGGKGDVSESNVLWTGRDRGRISTPIYFQDRLYWISGGIVNCVDARTGEEIYQARMQTTRSDNNLDRDSSGFGRSRFGRGGGFGGQSYSSPVVAGNRMYYFDRQGNATVIELGNEYKQLARNSFTEDGSDFHSTPAISNGQLFVRSNAFLYCIAED